jgi:hypothetical protein
MSDFPKCQQYNTTIEDFDMYDVPCSYFVLQDSSVGKLKLMDVPLCWSFGKGKAVGKSRHKVNMYNASITNIEDNNDKCVQQFVLKAKAEVEHRR